MRIRMLIVLAIFSFVALNALPQTLPADERPAWLADDGIVMAGSWEALIYRVRRDGPDFTITPEQRASYDYEHSPEMAAWLKSLGVNFVMTHNYKGTGWKMEIDGMRDAARFSQYCHDLGMKVGVYVYSGAFLWEQTIEDEPKAAEWYMLDENKEPLPYFHMKFRRYFSRWHPDAKEYYKKIIRFAIEEVKTDLIHFDNHHRGPGYEEVSVQLFREHLKENFSPAMLKEMGVEDVDQIEPPPLDEKSMLGYAWLNFRCQATADVYLEMSQYARSLRPDILVECNPLGLRDDRIHDPLDHSRLLQGGDAFWDESRPSGLKDGKLITRIRTYKFGRLMKNVTFSYIARPVEAAESMAYNMDCLGYVVGFEYGNLVDRDQSKIHPRLQLMPFIKFYNDRRDLLKGAKVVSDVAVWRSFASQVYADPKYGELTGSVEQKFIEDRVPFQLIYDMHLDDLTAYKTLVLVGCIAISDEQVSQIKDFVASGGGLCIIGPAAMHDEWLRPRDKAALDDLSGENIVRIDESGDASEAAREACGGTFSVTVTPPENPIGLCIEQTEQPGRRLVHFVNYLKKQPYRDVLARVVLPSGKKAKSVRLAGPLMVGEKDLSFIRSKGAVSFRVPSIDVYKIAIVDFE